MLSDEVRLFDGCFLLRRWAELSGDSVNDLSM